MSNCKECERLRIRCDGYQASRDWAINKLAATLNVEADTGRAVEFYARLAAEEIEHLRAESSAFEQAWKDACERAENLAQELAAVKALLREVLVHLDDTWGAGELCNTIRAELGD